VDGHSVIAKTLFVKGATMVTVLGAGKVRFNTLPSSEKHAILPVEQAVTGIMNQIGEGLTACQLQFRIDTGAAMDNIYANLRANAPQDATAVSLTIRRYYGEDAEVLANHPQDAEGLLRG
jgi:hypothetical protein